MANKTYAGILPAFPTPTAGDGTVDKAALTHLVRHLIENGAEGLVPIGGTGEFTALTPDRRLEVVETTLEAANGEVPVIAGVLCPGLADAVQAGESYRKAGVDALLVIAPFYVVPTQAGIRDYYKAYRDSVDVDILLYDIPSRTRVIVEAETVARIAEDGSVVGMKACNPDINHFNHVATLVEPDFALLSGEDTHFPLHMIMGAKGGILATASLLMKPWVDIYKMCLSADYAGAVKAQQALLPLIDAIFSEANPGPLKAALELLGQPAGPALPPLMPPQPETIGRLKKALGNLGEYPVRS